MADPVLAASQTWEAAFFSSGMGGTDFRRKQSYQ